MLAAVVAALAVPVGFALSLSSGSGADRAGARLVPSSPAASVAIRSPVVVSSDQEGPSPLENLSDSVKLFVVGTLLVGLAAAVRKAV